MIAAFVLVLMAVLLLAGVPVGFVLAACGAVGLYLVGGTGMVSGFLATAPLSSVSSYEIITIPMFILMAELVIISGVADELFGAAATWVGRVRGGLGVATAFAGAGFGAISGSSTASAATLSATSIPAMLKHGYEPKLACGAVAISGTLAMLIPPSIALVLFGIIAEVNIGKLLIGGVIPGLLVTVTIAATVMLLATLDPRRAPAGRAYAMGEKLASLRVAGPMILLFMAVTGVIYLGVATPTEASAAGAAGALLLAWANRRLTWRGLVAALVAAARTTCMILLIIVGAKMFSFFFTLTKITQGLVAWIAAAGLAPVLVLLLVLALYFVLGCIMDQIAILVLTVPIVLPVMTSLGYDPVWFGVVAIVMAEIGMVTPPFGMNAFVVSKYTGRPLEEVFGGVWPHVWAHLAVVALLCVFPQLVLWLPSLMQ